MAHDVSLSLDLKTLDYFSFTMLPFSDPEFLAGSLPFAVPLFYKLLGFHYGNLQTVVFFQVLFSVISWTCLAWAVDRSLVNKWVRFCAFSVILGIGSTHQITRWDFLIGSESISVSLLALLLGCCISIHNRRSKWNLYVAVLLAVLWAHSRDTNAYVLAFISGIIVVLSISNKLNWKRWGFLCCSFFMSFSLSVVSSDIGRRWVFPFLNVMAQRILTDQAKLSYFSKHGMPVTPALMRRTGKWASSDLWSFYYKPALESFRLWLFRDGKKAYIGFLVSHPIMTLCETIANLHLLLEADNTDDRHGGFASAAWKCINGFFYVNDLRIVVIWLFGLIVFAVMIRRLLDFSMTIPIILIAITLPHAYVVWHGDAMHVQRHALQVGIHFRLGLWTISLSLLDKLVSNVSNRVSEVSDENEY